MTKRGNFRKLRRAGFVMALLALVYFAGAGFFLYRIASGLMTVGKLSASLDQSQHPTDPMQLGYRGTPMAALGLPFDTVSVPTDLGPAEAWFVDAPANAAAQPGFAAIYVHGIAGAREDGYRHLSMLHKAGIPTLLISYRNDAAAPLSAEAAYAFGLTEWHDLDAAAKLMVDKGYPRLLIVAESMGGGILGQFLAQSPVAKNVVAVALDSPALDVHAVLGHIASGAGLPFGGGVVTVAQWYLVAAGPVDTRRAQVTATYAAFPGPMFIAHGSTDRIVPQASTDTFLRLRTGPTISLLTGADHLLSWQEDPARYGAAFADFLAQIPK